MGQCSTISSGMGKSATFAVAKFASIPTAAAAMRQSAWCTVTPFVANWRRQLPARMPSAAPRGASRRPRNNRSATACSIGRKPRQISSMEITHTQGSMPCRLRPAVRREAGRPRSASIRTVESSNKRGNAQPARRASPWRCRCTQSAGSASQSWPDASIPRSAASTSSQRRSSSRPRRTSSPMNALRRRAPARRSSSATNSSSNAMCRRMCQG